MLLIKNGEPLPNFSPLILPQVNTLARAVTEGQLTDAYNEQAAGEPFSAIEDVADAMSFAATQEVPDACLERAHAEAVRIIAEAQGRVEEIERAARARAIEDARSSIDAQLASQLEPLRAQLTESLAYVAGLREQIATYAEHELVQLALEIARKVVRREVTVDREIVISLTRVALGRLRNRALATVYLHPEDYQHVAGHRERLGAGNTIKLVEDPSISRGGCLIETDLGQVDARIEQQFSEIERGFFHGLEAQ